MRKKAEDLPTLQLPLKKEKYMEKKDLLLAKISVLLFLFRMAQDKHPFPKSKITNYDSFLILLHHVPSRGVYIKQCSPK